MGKYLVILLSCYAVPVLAGFANMRSDAVDGDKYSYRIPANAGAIVYLLHSDDEQKFVRDQNNHQFINSLIAQGYGVVSISGHAHADSSGAILPVGSHKSFLQLLEAVHQRLIINEQGYREQMPLFAVGFSNAGCFTAYLASLSDRKYPKLSVLTNLRAISLYSTHTHHGINVKRNYKVPMIMSIGLPGMRKEWNKHTVSFFTNAN